MSSIFERVKILVAGDSGVGKTSLVHLIAHQDILKKSSWTIGCSVDVKLHEFKDGTKEQKTCFLEFYDIGGNISHRKSAKMFYNSIDGIILVHDLTNRKSEDNLHYWLSEILEENESISILGSSPSSNDSFHSPVKDQSSIPLIVIGTKLDKAQLVRNSESLRTASSYIATQHRADEINLDCMDPKYLAPATTNSVKLAKFFNKAIAYKIAHQNRVDSLTSKNNFQSKLK